MDKVSRNIEVDILKGLGITLVVIGHVVLGDVKDAIYSFHMPLFFFLSGYLFSNNQQKGKSQLVSDKAISLLIPYFVYLFLSAIILRPFNFFNHSLLENVEYLTTLIYGGEKLFGVFWFVTVLYFVYIISYSIYGLFSGKKVLIIAIVFLFFSYLVNSFLATVSFPWNAQVALHAFPFFVFGNLFRRNEKSLYHSYVVLLSIIIVIAGLCFVKEISYDMKYSDYGIPFLSFLYALFFIFLMKKIAFHISKLGFLSSLLVELGKASLVIMYLHLIFINVFKKYIGIDSTILLVMISTILAYLFYLFFIKYEVSRVLFLGSKKDYYSLIKKIK